MEFKVACCGEIHPESVRLQKLGWQLEKPVGAEPAEKARVLGPDLKRCLVIREHHALKSPLISQALTQISPPLFPPLPGALHRPEACTKALTAPRLARCGPDASRRCAHALVLCTGNFWMFWTGEEEEAGEAGGETTPCLLTPPLSTPSAEPTPYEVDLFRIPGWREGGGVGGASALLHTVPAPSSLSSASPLAPCR